MLVYEYITLSVEVASVVEPKVHLASIPETVPGLGAQEREPLVPFITLIVPLGLSTGSSNTETQQRNYQTVIYVGISLPNSLKRTSS